jgi:hypothetical protein
MSPEDRAWLRWWEEGAGPEQHEPESAMPPPPPRSAMAASGGDSSVILIPKPMPSAPRRGPLGADDVLSMLRESRARAAARWGPATVTSAAGVETGTNTNIQEGATP